MKASFWQTLGPEVIKLFSCSTQLSMKFFLLINVKMPTIVGILTFMSRKNSILSLSEPEKCCISWYFHTYKHFKFHAQLSWVWKKFCNLGARSKINAVVPEIVNCELTDQRTDGQTETRPLYHNLQVRQKCYLKSCVHCLSTKNMFCETSTSTEMFQATAVFRRSTGMNKSASGSSVSLSMW